MNRLAGRTLLAICLVAFAVGDYELGNARDDASPSPWPVVLTAFNVLIIVGAIYYLHRQVAALADPVVDMRAIADEAVERMGEALDERLDVMGLRMQSRADELMEAIVGPKPPGGHEDHA